MRSNLVHGGLAKLALAVVLAGAAGFAVAQSDNQAVNAGQQQGETVATGDANTLTGVLSHVINSNPKVLSQWRAMKAAQDEIGVAWGGYLPSVDVTAGVGILSRENDGGGSFGTESARLSLTQMLYDGGYTPNEVDRLTHASRVRYYQLLDTIQTVSLDAVKSYLGVRRYRELVDLARSNYTFHLDVYDRIQARFQAGAGTEANLEQITGRLALAKSNLKTAGANLHDVMVRYQRVVGHLPPDNLTPAPTLDEKIPATSADAVVHSIKDNPAFHAAIENIYATQARYDRTMSAFLPHLNLQAHVGTTNKDVRTYHREEAAAELVVSMNLFNGGSDSSSRDQAWDLVQRAKQDRRTQCVNLRQTTQIAYNDIRELTGQMQFLRQHAISSGRVLTAYQQQFRIGQRTLLDVLDSENEYFQARRAYVNSQYDLQLAYARTQAAMGHLMKSVGLRSEKAPTLAELGTDPLEYNAKAFCPTVGVPEFTFAELLGNQPKPVGKPDVVLSGNTLFELNKYNLTPAAKKHLGKVLQHIQSMNDLQGIFIAGYTDSSGTPAINEPLSKHRAESVARFLVKHGVEPSMITARGYGANDPIESNATAAGRQANRRVEITFDRAGDT